MDAEVNFAKVHAESGLLVCELHPDSRPVFRGAFGKLLETKPENISFIQNCAVGLNLIAQGYPFAPGDEVISYIHEYPSNHFPWKLQEARGVILKLLSNSSPDGLPGQFSLQELATLITPRTRLVALSHVQFTSGFAVDLHELGALCKSKNVDLVIDAAQSLGALPVVPEACGISALVASGWKWLLGPIGTGVLYTSENFRDKIAITHAGPDHMHQQDDFLDHSWNPFGDSRKFEYSTLPHGLVAGLAASAESIFVNYGIERITTEVFRLQDYFLETLNRAIFRPVELQENNRSGIISLRCPGDPKYFAEQLKSRGFITSVRGPYLRIAPHFYNVAEELQVAAKLLNNFAEEKKDAHT